MRANLAAPAVLASTLHLSMRANLAAPAGFALCPDLSMLAKRSIFFVPRSDWRLGEGGIGCWQWARDWRCGDGLGGGRWLFWLQPSSKRARRDVLDPAPAGLGCGGAADTAGAGLGIGGRFGFDHLRRTCGEKVAQTRQKVRRWPCGPLGAAAAAPERCFRRARSPKRGKRVTGHRSHVTITITEV